MPPGATGALPRVFAGCAVFFLIERARLAISGLSLSLDRAYDQTLGRALDDSQLSTTLARAHDDVAVLVVPARGVLDVSIVRSWRKDSRAAVGGKLDPFPRPSRQG